MSNYTINRCVSVCAIIQMELDTFNKEHAKRKHAFENLQKLKRPKATLPLGVVDHKAGSAASGGTEEG